MPLVVEDLIQQAREEDASFTARRHPNRAAVNYLSRLQRRLVAEWAKLEETMEVEVFTIDFPLDDFDAGEFLQEDGESVGVPLDVTAWHTPGDLNIDGRETPEDIDIIQWGDRNRRKRDRACWIREDTVFFTGHEDDYNHVTSVELTYTPTPGDIAALDEELVLPLTAEDALVMWLAAFFARRSTEAELSRSRKREIKQEALDAEALWLDEIRRRQPATVSRTRAVW